MNNLPIGTSSGGDLSVEATVDIGADTVTMVTGGQAVTQAVGDTGTGLEGGDEQTVALQSETQILIIFPSDFERMFA